MYLKDENYTAWSNKWFRLVVNYDDKTKLKTVNLNSNHGNKNNNLFTIVFNELGIISSPKYQPQLESINEILSKYDEKIISNVITIKHILKDDFDINMNVYLKKDVYIIYKNGIYFRNLDYSELGHILQYCISEFGE